MKEEDNGLARFIEDWFYEYASQPNRHICGWGDYEFDVDLTLDTRLLANAIKSFLKDGAK